MCERAMATRDRSTPAKRLPPPSQINWVLEALSSKRLTAKHRGHSQAHLSNSRYSLARGAVGVCLHVISIQLMKKPVGLKQSPNTRRVNYVKERPTHRALRNTERGRDPGRSRRTKDSAVCSVLQE